MFKNNYKDVLKAHVKHMKSIKIYIMIHCWTLIYSGEKG